MKKNIYLLLFLLIFIFSFFVNKQTIVAAGETITLERIGAEKNSQTNKWDWRFSITTTGGVENSDIWMKIYTGNVTADGSNLYHQETAGKLKDNKAEINTDFILEDNQIYSISFTINMKPVLHAVYKNTTGDTQSQGDVINFTPQTNTTTNKSDVYTLLAPIGKFKVAPDNIGEYFNTIFLIAIGLCGVLAVIMIVIGGIQYMGDESVFGKTQAKERITKAILGLIIALGAFALLNTINPELLGGGGVNIKQVSADIEEEDFPLTSNDNFTSGQKTQNCPEGIVFANTINGKIPVCSKLKTKVELLISDANKAGLKIFGYGYRSKQKQEALRSQNCGGASNIYNPKAKCQPLTALPGRSRHENGLAIDFTCDGSTIRSRDNKCFVWLQKNGEYYGFKNLQKEPWHWSTDGK